MAYVIDFIPPLEGMGGDFNTIRIGLAWAKRLNVGDKVFILNNKERFIIGEALVTAIHTGTLEELCAIHATENHINIACQESEDSNACLRLMNVVTKMYGPHIATPTKKATVIALRRLG